MSSAAFRTVGEPSFALSWRQLGDPRDERVGTLLPFSAFGVAPRDRIGHPQQRLLMRSFEFVVERVAKSVTPDFTEQNLTISGL